MQRWEQGEEVHHVISFEDHNHLKQTFSPRHIAILRHLLNNPNTDISVLAKNLRQNIEQIKDDLQLLEKYNIISYREQDKNQQAYILYEHIKIENE